MKSFFKSSLLIISVMAFIIISFSSVRVSATEIVDITDDKYDGGYTIEEMINKYNVITLGTKKPNVNVTDYDLVSPFGRLADCAHIVGPILIEGNLENKDTNVFLYHSQVVKGVSSFIKGMIKNGGNAMNEDGTNPNFYVGVKNVVEMPYSDQEIYHINGYEWYTRYETKKTDEYIDFNILASTIIEEQKYLASGTILEPDSSGRIYVQAGGTYTIESLSNVNEIIFDNLTKDINETTMITITDPGDTTGKIHFPLLLKREGDKTEQIVTGNTEGSDEFYGGNVVWNITDAEYITFTKAPFIGHLIAPQADVKLEEMNFAGTFIVNSLQGSGGTEGHYFPYKGKELEKSELVPIPKVIKVSISKLDDNNKPLAGAELEIIDRDGNRVAIWTSTTDSHELLGMLKAGETYTLHEIKAPDGYELAEDMEFTVQDTNDIQEFKMINKKKNVKVHIEKRDQDGIFVVGAQMQLLDIDGNLIDEWTTSYEVHDITANMIIGQKYIIHEVSAPPGYKLAEDIGFTFQQTNDIQRYIVTDVKDPTITTISILKIDNNNRVLEGAELEILDKNGNQVAHWISTSEAYIIKGILVPNEVYTLHEIKAPTGYKLADDIQFTIKDTTDVQKIKLVNKNDTIVSPDTGDTLIIKYIIIGAISIVGILLLVVLLKKRKLK